MRYRLRTLVILTAVGPPLIAGTYWTAIWLGGQPMVLGVAVMVALAAAWVFGLVAWYRELLHMISGPNAAQSWRRRRRRRFRVRIERYAYGST